MLIFRTIKLVATSHTCVTTYLCSFELFRIMIYIVFYSGYIVWAAEKVNEKVNPVVQGYSSRYSGVLIRLIDVVKLQCCNVVKPEPEARREREMKYELVDTVLRIFRYRYCLNLILNQFFFFTFSFIHSNS